MLTVTEISPPLLDGAPHPELAEVVDLSRRWGEARVGHDDFEDGVEGLANRLCGHAAVARRLWVVRDGERMVGSLQLDLPLRDNRHLADLEPRLDPGVDPVAVLELLWQTVRPVLARGGRSAVALWMDDGTRAGTERIAPSTGSGDFGVDEVAHWLLAKGFVLDQVERASLLRVPEGLADLDALQASAEQAGADYQLVQWIGPTPPELRGAMAVLRGRMSTDAPIGEMPMEAELWDAERVRELDELHVRGRRQDVWTIAVHRDTGEPVAHTYLTVPEEKDSLAWQEDTLVRSDHRGHRLGLRVKVANLRQLMAVHPGIRRVRTWNAEENAHMLGINEALGFRPDSVEGLWLLQLEGEASE